MFAVDRLDVPQTVRQGEAFTVRGTIQSSTQQSVRLRWERDGVVVDERVVDVKAGTNEGCGEIGRGEAVAAHAVVLLAGAG